MRTHVTQTRQKTHAFIKNQSHMSHSHTLFHTSRTFKHVIHFSQIHTHSHCVNTLSHADVTKHTCHKLKLAYILVTYSSNPQTEIHITDTQTDTRQHVNVTVTHTPHTYSHSTQT